MSDGSDSDDNPPTFVRLEDENSDEDLEWEDPSGGAFNITARRVLCGNPNVATKLAEVLAKIPDGPAEPKALS